MVCSCALCTCFWLIITTVDVDRLFVGSSKIQVAAIRGHNQHNYTKFVLAMLYLEKVLTQTMYDHTRYNSINNKLYLPKVRALATQLVLHQLRRAEDDQKMADADSLVYIVPIFEHWCTERRFITLETFPWESRFMSGELKDLLSSVSKLRQLFPCLQSYRGTDGNVHFVHDDQKSAASAQSPRAFDVPIHTSERKQWECSNCKYVNKPLMVGSLWRFCNEVNICGLCDNHQHAENDKRPLDHGVQSTESSSSQQEDLRLSKKDEIKHGFSSSLRCWVGVPDLIYVIEFHIFDDVSKKRPLLADFKEKILSFLTEQKIDGAQFKKLGRMQFIKKMLECIQAPQKLFCSLLNLYKAIDTCLNDDRESLQSGDHEEKTKYVTLLQQCPAMKRLAFICQYFEEQTAKVECALSSHPDSRLHFECALSPLQLPSGGKYPLEMGRFLSSLPDYRPARLLNDIDHVHGHNCVDSLKCDNGDKCVHFKRSRREEDAGKYRDVNKKRELFNCNKARDFIYIDMLDRVHVLLRHSHDVDHNKRKDVKRIKDDVRATRPIFHVGVFMDYCALSPLHHNLYQELTRNRTAHRLARHQFQSQLDAVGEFMKSESPFLRSTACKTDKRHGITKGDSVAVQHLLVLLFYKHILSNVHLLRFMELWLAVHDSRRRVNGVLLHIVSLQIVCQAATATTSITKKKKQRRLCRPARPMATITLTRARRAT